MKSLTLKDLEGLSKRDFDNAAVRESIAVTIGQLENAKEALKEIDSYNPLGNDLDAYLLEVNRWGRGLIKKKPNKKDFGL